MPSIILGNQSGGQNILSGAYWSGRLGNPTVAGVQLRLAATAAGNAYVGLSGGVTVNSGAVIGSGGMSSGLLDGFLLTPGDTYFLPRIAVGASGIPQVFVGTDAAASGQARMYVECF